MSRTRNYVVLRDQSRRSLAGPFHLGPAATGTPGAVMPDPSLRSETLEPKEAAALSKEPEVLQVAEEMPTRLVRPVSVEADSWSAAAPRPAWGITAVGADKSQRSGQGATVAVLDTGIDSSHAAFQGHGIDLIERDFTGEGDGDAHGHGTHCAGTIFGRDVNNTRIGVATGVQRALIGKVLDSNGQGTTRGIHDAILWAAGEGATIISMSLGFDVPGMVDRLVQANWPADLAASRGLEAYRANIRLFDALAALLRSQTSLGLGSLVVAAAGNESRRWIRPDYEVGTAPPAVAQGVVAVGALAYSGPPHDQLEVAGFSNSSPNVSAPGVQVLSAKAGGGLQFMSGTSMAAPHVAGLAALHWEALSSGGAPVSPGLLSSRVVGSATRAGFASGTDWSDVGSGLARAPA